jgi:hypothetical protein
MMRARITVRNYPKQNTEKKMVEPSIGAASHTCTYTPLNATALFFGSDPVGYDPKTGKHAFMPNVISISPLDEGRKYYYFGSLGEVEARYPRDASSKQDFEYEMKDAASGWAATERYYASEERWTYKMDSGRKEVGGWVGG